MKYQDLKKAKSLREVLDIIPNILFEKISFYSLIIWCLIPIFILITNAFVKGSSANYFFFGLVYIGFIGLINGFGYIFKNKLKLYKKIPFILLLIFLGWSFLACLGAPNKVDAFFGTFYRKEGFVTYLWYMGMFLHGFVVSKQKTYIKKILNCLIISSTILGLLVMMHNGLTDLFLKDNNVPGNIITAGVFCAFNHYGYYLTISIMAIAILFLYEKKVIYKLLYLLCFIVLVYVLGKNNTLGCFVALLVSFVIMLIYYFVIKEHRISACFIMLLFLGISLMSPFKQDVLQLGAEIENIYTHADNLDVSIDDTIGASHIICSGTGRLDLWLKGIDFIKERPLFGYGFDNLGPLYQERAICAKTDRPHNTFIQIGANTGIIGLILYVSSIIYIYVVGLQKYKKLNKMLICCFFITCSYLISSCFGNSMYYTSPYYLFILGIISSVCIEKNT